MYFKIILVSVLFFITNAFAQNHSEDESKLKSRFQKNIEEKLLHDLLLQNLLGESKNIGSKFLTTPKQYPLALTDLYNTTNSDHVFRGLFWQTSMQDSLALMALYNSTNGENWTRNDNWLTAPVSAWYGVTVSRGRVTRLLLHSNNLVGTIPSELGNLASLQQLWLFSNKLSGSIP